MPESPESESAPPAPSRGGDVATDRRLVLRGLAAVGVLGASAPLLAACGDDSAPAAQPSAGASSASTGGSSAPSSSPSGAPSEASGPAYAKVADVPVGGAVIVAAQRVVVSQPQAGTFKAFSAVCTHQSCPVSVVKNDTVVCTCHGSAFSTSDGSVRSGPAKAPLGEMPVKVSGGEVRPA